MSATSVSTVRAPSSRSYGPLVAKVAVVVALAAAALAVYGAYGDPHPKAGQKSAVPSLIVLSTLVTAIVFAVLVPRALRAIEAGSPRANRWALWHGVAAVVLLPVFWSGVPLVVGTAAALLGSTGLREASAQAMPARAFSATRILGLVAVVGSVAISVLGNTL